uniref:enoyl-CoA hydratase/isomerase family protein n=1 Tax=Alteribacillus sp. YIM 98480 TaxID=2606599 RepID=UPI001E42DFB9
YRLPRYVGMRRAKELMLTGKLLSGKKCEEWGLVNVSAPFEELDKVVDEFLEPLVDKSPFVMWITKMAANRGLDADTDTLMVLEHLACNVVHQSGDAREGVQAFLNKREPAWTGL